jgi:hypothetical protein
MRLNDIITDINEREAIQPLLNSQVDLISSKCSDFLNESNGLCLKKTLNKSNTFTKLKARIKKYNDNFSESFNNAFIPKLRQRAIYANSIVESLKPTYYIFPINGYKYLYNPNVYDSTIYETVRTNIGNEDLFKQLLQDNYTDSNLIEGISSGAEILFHSIPFCYAVNIKSFPDYSDLFNIISNMDK